MEKVLRSRSLISRGFQRARLSTGAGLTHVKSDGSPGMVDVSAKSSTHRKAHARATVVLPPEVSALIDYEKNDIFGKKGAVFVTAKIAGVMALKKTSDLIPFCHPIGIESSDIDIAVEGEDKDEQSHVIIDCHTATTGKTGVEMEALMGATQAALCIYDMLKAVSHDIVIKDVRLMAKSGGKATFARDSDTSK